MIEIFMHKKPQNENSTDKNVFKTYVLGSYRKIV